MTYYSTVFNRRVRSGDHRLECQFAGAKARSLFFHGRPHNLGEQQALPLYYGQVIADEMADMLGIKPGHRVAEIGAGNGAIAIRMARKVGPAGHVFATEIDPVRLDRIRKRARKAGLDNVTAVAATPSDSGLPAGCCDAAYMIGVYHHLTDPAATDTSIFDALKPGARLLVDDFPPTIWLALFKVKGRPANRSGHGVGDEIVINELSAAGFRRVTERRPWHPGFLIRDNYCLVFSRGQDADPVK